MLLEGGVKLLLRRIRCPDAQEDDEDAGGGAGGGTRTELREFHGSHCPLLCECDWNGAW